MHGIRSRMAWLVAGLAGLILPVAGCPSNADDADNLLNEIAAKIFGEVEFLQNEDPRSVNLPDELDDDGDTVVINNNVVIVNNIQEDIIVEEIPDATLLGFENLRDLDAYFSYTANGEFQGIFVFAGETLLLDYPCLDDVELLAEEYFDPVDGTLVEANDLFDALFLNPDDFFCGEALIFSFDDFDILTFVEPIDLIE